MDHIETALLMYDQNPFLASSLLRDQRLRDVCYFALSSSPSSSSSTSGVLSCKAFVNLLHMMGTSPALFLSYDFTMPAAKFLSRNSAEHHNMQLELLTYLSAAVDLIATEEFVQHVEWCKSKLVQMKSLADLVCCSSVKAPHFGKDAAAREEVAVGERLDAAKEKIEAALQKLLSLGPSLTSSTWPSKMASGNTTTTNNKNIRSFFADIDNNHWGAEMLYSCDLAVIVGARGRNPRSVQFSVDYSERSLASASDGKECDYNPNANSKRPRLADASHSISSMSSSSIGVNGGPVRDVPNNSNARIGNDVQPMDSNSSSLEPNSYIDEIKIAASLLFERAADIRSNFKGSNSNWILISGKLVELLCDLLLLVSRLENRSATSSRSRLISTSSSSTSLTSTDLGPNLISLVIFDLELWKLSEDSMLRLTQSFFAAYSKHSNKNVDVLRLFVISIVVKIRQLTSPASRIFMKVIEIIAEDNPGVFIDSILVRLMVSHSIYEHVADKFTQQLLKSDCSKSVEINFASVDLSNSRSCTVLNLPGNPVFEVIQRLLRQIPISKENLDGFIRKSAENLNLAAPALQVDIIIYALMSIDSKVAKYSKEKAIDITDKVEYKVRLLNCCLASANLLTRVCDRSWISVDNNFLKVVNTTLSMQPKVQPGTIELLVFRCSDAINEEKAIGTSEPLSNNTTFVTLLLTIITKFSNEMGDSRKELKKMLEKCSSVSLAKTALTSLSKL